MMRIGYQGTIFGLYLSFLEHQRLQHILHIFDHIFVLKIGYDICDRTPYVALDEVGDLRRIRREPFDFQVVVQKYGRNLHAVEEVFHIVVGVGQLLILGLQLSIEGCQLLVEGLQLLF